MELNDLLRRDGIDPKDVIVFRHAPKHMPKLRQAFLWLAKHDHEFYNTCQQTQGPRTENAMLRAEFVCSCIGHKPGMALFVGLYSITGSIPMSYKQFWNKPKHVVLRDTYGMYGMTDKGSTTLWFNLDLLGFEKAQAGKMQIEWPGRERSWWRWADRNAFPILRR